MTEYAIKVYDKTGQVESQEKIKILKKILRIEFCYNQKRKLPKGLVTLADLMNEDCIGLLYKNLEDGIKEIVFIEEFDLNNSTLEERILFFASLNSGFLEVEKKLNKEEIKTVKKKIKQLRERFFKKGFKSFLLKSLKEKYIALYCS